MKGLAVFGLFCLFLTGVIGQEKGECSLTTEYGIKVLGCFLIKYQPLLDLILPNNTITPDNTSPDGAFGESSPSHGDSIRIGAKDYGHQTQSYVLRNIVTKLNAKDQNKLSEEALKVQAHKINEDVVDEIIKNVDFNVIQRSFVNNMLDVIALLRKHTLAMAPVDMSLTPTPDNPIIDAILTALDTYCFINRKDPFCIWYKANPVTMRDLLEMLLCLTAYEELDFEEDFKWAKCAFKCEDFPAIGQCMHDAFTDCRVSTLNGLVKINLEWLADLALRVVVDHVEMDTCYFSLEGDIDQNGTITINEGAPPAQLVLSSYLPPGVHCMDKLQFTNTPAGVAKYLYEFITGNMGKCNVDIELTLSNYLRDALSMTLTVPVLGVVKLQSPSCPFGERIPQAVLQVDDYFNTTTGSIRLNATNWNKKFHVAIQATVDNKQSFESGLVTNIKLFQNQFLGIRVRAGILKRNTTKKQIEIEDPSGADNVQAVRTCWTVSDPHVQTFKGTVYRAFHEGYFYLYKHATLPYEVQVVYQMCGEKNRTCTCGASVKSGDDVFTVDWCRRKGETERTQRVTLYLVSKTLNPGTRIFRQNGGLKYKVLLPHGQFVTIASTDGWLNVWVKPSAFDNNKAQGLCGYLGAENGDMILPNGTEFKDSDTRPFVDAWRVPEEEIILKGASMNITNETLSEDVNMYCVCSHIILLGSQCTCGPDQLARVCSHEADGEITDQLNLITKYSVKQFLLDHPDESDEDLPDVDAEYSPPIIDCTGSSSKAACKTWIDKDEANKICLPVFGPNPYYMTFKKMCECDAQLSGGNVSLSSKMAAREYCHNQLDRQLGKKRKVYKDMFLVDCPNDCNSQLTVENKCVKGVCVCDPSFKGIDCSIPAGAEPTLIMPKYSACDSRYTNCSFATVYGKNFVDNELSCNIKYLNSDSSVVNQPLFISPYQVACELPSSGDKFMLSIVKRSSTRQASLQAASFEFDTYDSQCHVFDVQTGKLTPRKAEDYCLVDNVCYAEGEICSTDECYYCDPKTSQNELQYKENEHCAAKEQERLDNKKEWNIRIIVAVVFSSLIVIVTLIIFLLSRNNGNSEKGLDIDETGGVGSSENVYSNSGQGEHTINGHIYDVPDTALTGKQAETEMEMEPRYGNIPGPDEGGVSEINAKELAEFWYMKQKAMENSRQRSTSVGSRSSSVGTSGIGGGSNMGPGRMRGDSMASIGMGAAGPAHMGRFARRAYSNSSAGITDDEDPVDKFGIGGGGTGGTGMISRL